MSANKNVAFIHCVEIFWPAIDNSKHHLYNGLTQLCNASKVVPEPRGLTGWRWSRFISSQPDTSLNCKIMDTWWLLHHAVWLFAPQLLLVLIAPTHEGISRLSWPRWLVINRDGSQICRRLPIAVLSSEQQRWSRPTRYQWAKQLTTKQLQQW